MAMVVWSSTSTCKIKKCTKIFYEVCKNEKNRNTIVLLSISTNGFWFDEFVSAKKKRKRKEDVQLRNKKKKEKKKIWKLCFHESFFAKTKKKIAGQKPICLTEWTYVEFWFDEFFSLKKQNCVRTLISRTACTFFTVAIFFFFC